MPKIAKPLKITIITLLSAIGLIVLAVASYVLYVVIEFTRIEDNVTLDVTSNASTILKKDTSYSALTYNIGFGAYSPEYSFFMDEGVLANGKKVSGKYGKGINKADVQKNTDGSVKIIKDRNPDFVLVQEVDVVADRSYKINQLTSLESLGDYALSYAENFHSAFLFYPFNDPHGKTNAGIATLSKYKISSAVRRSFPVDLSFPTKFFDLDRCFSVNYIPVEKDNTLVLINLHMSAYDEGGTIRAKQLEMLNAVLKEEYDKGNYVIAGGDFNHDISNSVNAFTSTEKVPDYVYQLQDSDLASGFTFAKTVNAPTCRSACAPYVKGESYSVVLDGFICSDNVVIETIENLDYDFAYSDHNPVLLNFKLK